MNVRQTVSRRGALLSAAAAALAARATGALAGNGLSPTPSQSEGPYYPVNRPAPAGNDLIHGGGGARAEGQPLRLAGRVLDTAGQPVPGVRIEIWQADARGIYRHPRAPSQGSEDPLFHGFGMTATDTLGAYWFLTIVPVIYTGRPPHIHAKVAVPGRRVLTTQLYLEGHPANDRDGLLSRIIHGSRERLMIDPRPSDRDVPGGYEAQFDFVVET